LFCIIIKKSPRIQAWKVSGRDFCESQQKKWNNFKKKSSVGVVLQNTFLKFTVVAIKKWITENVWRR
jgi:hypothetical protein